MSRDSELGKGDDPNKLRASNIPKIAPLRKIFSWSVNSGQNPVPTSSNDCDASTEHDDARYVADTRADGKDASETAIYSQVGRPQA
jgi:hypothetical protein